MEVITLGSYTILERQKLRKMEELENKIDKIQQEETKKEKQSRIKEYKKDLKKALEIDLYNYFLNEFEKRQYLL